MGSGDFNAWRWAKMGSLGFPNLKFSIWLISRYQMDISIQMVSGWRDIECLQPTSASVLSTLDLRLWLDREIRWIKCPRLLAAA